MLSAGLDAVLGDVGPVLAALAPRLTVEDVGRVTYVSREIARVAGLPGVSSAEVVRFNTGATGMAFDLTADEVGVILLGDAEGIAAGTAVRRARRVVDIPVGPRLLGRVLDPAGRPLDNLGDLEADERRPIERPAPPIMDRAPVTVPLQTGIKVVDALVPIGRGQRELILGDQNTGKTTIAVDAILNQADTGVLAIYCAIGQEEESVARVIDVLRQHGALERAVVVAATGVTPPGLQYVAPYAATTIGEHFMEQGRDVLIVYDDLTRHARAYRELSLLLRRPPGREAYPGDIFYIHSRLLERATHLVPERGGGSLTALPIIETEAQNISSYIPTNLISITDGQVFLSPKLFQEGLLPAVDPGLSVSRVGGQAQLAAYRGVGSALRLAYSQYLELESFARFGARMDPDTRQRLERGRRVRAALQQQRSAPLPVADQIAILLAVTQGLFDTLTPDAIPRAEAALAAALATDLPGLAKRVASGAALADDDRARILELAKAVVAQLTGAPEADGDNGDA